MAQKLPPELISQIANQCDLQTYYRIARCCRRVYRLLIPNNLYFSTNELMEAIAHGDAERVERWMKTDYFKSSVFNCTVNTRYGYIRLINHLMDLACKWSVPKAAEILLEDPRLHDGYPDEWFRLLVLGPDPDAAFEVFHLIIQKHPPGNDRIISESVKYGKNRIFDYFFDADLNLYQELEALGYASEAGNIHVASRLMTRPGFDEHLKSFLRGEDYYGVPKTAEFIDYVMHGRDYNEYDFFNVTCWAMTDGKLDIAEYLCDRVDVSQHGLELALSGCIHGYFHLVRGWLKSEAWQYPRKEELLQMSDFELFQHFYGIPGISLEDPRDKIGSYCVSSRQVVDYMISKGTDVHRLLSESVLNGPVDVIQYLMAMDGVDFRDRDKQLFFLADLRRDPQVLPLLLGHPRTEFKRAAAVHACNACDERDFEWARTVLSHIESDRQKEVREMSHIQLSFYAETLASLLGS
ncbi:hypothetical protein EDD86DRAFT_208111 [Gorgonomyces haynaldii]|nr:hypothetical protein EDD86DRAFT_208111 [Gorgonomyces haynaldii]